MALSSGRGSGREAWRLARRAGGLAAHPGAWIELRSWHKRAASWSLTALHGRWQPLNRGRPSLLALVLLRSGRPASQASRGGQASPASARCAVLCCAVPCCTVPCCTVLYCTVLCCCLVCLSPSIHPTTRRPPSTVARPPASPAPTAHPPPISRPCPPPFAPRPLCPPPCPALLCSTLLCPALLYPALPCPAFPVLPSAPRAQG